MLNINRARANRARGSEDERKQRIEDIRAQMAVLRAAAERGRVRRLLRQSVSLQHVHVLTILRASGPLTVGELARALETSMASVTGIVSRMEQRELLTRTRSEQDRRVVSVGLARGGKAVLEQLEGPAREHFNSMLETLSLEELDSVQSGFRALRRAHDTLKAESLTA
jgi:DNA-binding MarR family transcriptional regulator